MMMQVQEELVVIKGKRTKRSRPKSSSLPETINTNNNTMIPSPTSCDDVATTTTTTSSSEAEHELRDKTEDDENMAHCLILLAQGHDHDHDHAHKASSSKHDDQNNNNKYLFQCKTCDRWFPSFQALGGHRASHNKPNNNNKLLLPNNSFVSDLNHDHCDINNTTRRPYNDFYGTSIKSTTSTKSDTTKAKSSHLCSICGAEFSSGQALGGHMRRHRNFLSTSSSMSGKESREAKKPRNTTTNNNVLRLDLNLPAPPEDDDDYNQRDQSSKFSFQTNEKVIVFSTASSLVDCHY